MDYQKIGKYIKEQRDKLGLSQQELGDKIFVTRQAVSSWENGKTLPDSDTLLSLSKLFKVTINDILCGESMEQVTLSLLDETNKKNLKIKHIIRLSFSMISILLIILLGSYFITNYNSIKVYKASASSDHFNIIDGIVISTSQNTYFKLGHLEYKKGDDIVVNKVKLYYLNNKEKEFIFESDVNDRLFVNNEGYDEIHKSNFSKIKDNLYLEVYFNDTEKEVLKIDLKEDFRNDYFMVLEESKIIKDYIKDTLPDLTLKYQEQEEQLALNTNVRDEKPVIKYETKKPVEEPTPIPVEQPVEEVVEVQEPTTVEEPVELEPTTPIEEPQEEIIVVEEPEININLEEISQLIEQYGRLELRTYRLDYVIDEDTAISIVKNRNRIIVESTKENEKKRYNIKVDGEEINYQRIINGSEEEQIVGSLEKFTKEEYEIVQDLYKYFSLIYQEIN